MRTSTKELLESAESIYKMLLEASRELTSEISSVCKSLQLPRVEVLLSLREFHEEESEGVFIVCGLYDPVSREILVSLPCLLRSGGEFVDKFLETLAHELVHHCQFAGGPGDICGVKLSVKDAELLAKILPYAHRPHEIEAYSKQRELSEFIKPYLGGSKKLLMRVLRTLRNNVEVEIGLEQLRWFSILGPDIRDECSVGSMLLKALGNFKVEEVEVVVNPDLSKEPGEAHVYVLIGGGIALRYLWHEDPQKDIYMPLKPVSIKLPGGEYWIKYIKASYDFLKSPLRSEGREPQYLILEPTEVESYIAGSVCRGEQKAIRAEDLVSLISVITLRVYGGWPQDENDVREILGKLSVAPRGNLIEISPSINRRGSYPEPEPISILVCKDTKIRVNSDSIEATAVANNWLNYLNSLVETVRESVKLCKISKSLRERGGGFIPFHRA
ncbi:hypothetical protein [Infirmifilum sp.]|uniref:hypothetical protein n=1 Tax=Infirmifilum sp. TaxID=2856575 RepID=UPI003D11C242